MLPVFRGMENIDFNNPREAVRLLAEHVKELERQLYTVLTSIDSSNMSGINISDTELKSEGGSSLSSDRLVLKGKHGEIFEAGYNTQSGRFVFKLSGADGDVPVEFSADRLSVGSLTAQKLLVQGSGSAKLYSSPGDNIYLQLTNKSGTMIDNYSD